MGEEKGGTNNALKRKDIKEGGKKERQTERSNWVYMYITHSDFLQFSSSGRLLFLQSFAELRADL